MNLPSLLLLTAALTLVGGSAFAQGTKIYPGTFCVGDGLTGSSGISYNWGVRAENKAVEKKVVNCPIIRDESSQLPLSATIYLYDSAREDSVECKFQSWTASGSQRSESPMRLSGAGFVGSRAIRFNNLSTTPGSTYNFLCKLPKDSFISSYKVEEQ